LSVQVKVCGVRTVEAAIWVREACADFAGLNFVPSSKRRIDVARARLISAELGEIARVGVFMDQKLEEIDKVARAIGLEWIQLHGKETPAFCAALKTRYKVVKAIAVDAQFSKAKIDAYRAHLAAFLFDGPKPGSGIPFAWSALQDPITDLPYFIAGGLDPENVEDAVRSLHPWGVDSASGVEIDGKQDRARIFEFVRAARLGLASP
jgi:phosphoribosylanthranilate isomerase